MRKIIQHLILFMGIALLLVSQAAYGQSAQNRAGLVIQSGDGSVATYCVEFEADSISGYEALQLSGVAVEASFDAMGAAICKIGTDGCGSDNCFCEFPPNYWSYWRLKGEAWSYSQLGTSNTILAPGQVDGWAWGQASPPPVISFDAICAAPPTAAPTNTSLPSETPTILPTETETPVPSETPIPTEDSSLSDQSESLIPSDTPSPSDTPMPTQIELSPTPLPEISTAIAKMFSGSAFSLDSLRTMMFPILMREFPASAATAPIPTASPTLQKSILQTPTPQPSPTRSVTPEPSPTTAAPTLITEAAAIPSNESSKSSPFAYLSFGFLALLLILGAIFFSLKNRRPG